MLAAVAASAATPLWAAEVNDVKARQRWPWNGLVDIDCTVSGIDGTDYGLNFAVAAVMPDSSVHNATSFWVAKDGKKSFVWCVPTNGNYRLIWDARADLGSELYSNVVMRVTVVSGHARAQLWEGGPYWAMTNVGAEKPEDYGLYFWWGDTVGYRPSSSGTFDFNFSKENSAIYTYRKDIATLQSENEKWVTEDGVLVPAHDAAQAHWGGAWRMPTNQELSDLVGECDWNWTTLNGVQGWTVTGRDAYASASIFLPCAGYGNGTSLRNAGSDGRYWSSVPGSDNYYDDASSLYFYSGDHYTNYGNRYYGRSVRAVQGFTEPLMVVAGVAHAGDSAKMVLDLRIGARASGGDETLLFSSLWDGDEEATVTITQDSVAIAENLAGEGERAWSVPYNGTYELTHVTYTNGVAGKVETAKFVVTGKAEPPEITDVVATPSEPWDGTVQIAFNVVNSPAAACPDWNQPYLSITATDNETGSNYVSSATALSAKAPYQIGDALAGSNGTHEVTWDFKAQGIDFASTNVTFTVAYVNMPEYCVIDLSGGTNAESYAVTYLDAVADPAAVFNTDAYKTDNLVMRLIGPGTFEMGYSGSTETTEITNAFYCAVFETTQRQWELVTGKRPSYFTNETCYATRPVEMVSWNMIRGNADTYDWPDVQGVASDSFVGVLRQKTGLDALDLPTEAQWEYACRAGTTTDYNNGKNWSGNNPCPNLNEVARYWYNGGKGSNYDSSTDNGTAAVGSYDPNKWGLYDMHGNVYEWCLDWYSSARSGRVKRGGSWDRDASNCDSSGRDGGYPSFEIYNFGFRFVRTLSNNLESERSAEAAAGAERAGTVCAGTASKPICIGGKDFAAGDIALADYSGVYDGEGHTIGIATNAIDGLVLRYSSPSSPSDTLPLFTNVCDMVVYVEASAPGYVAFTTNATVKITKASLKITARDQTYRYNGLQQGESDPIYATPEEIAEKVIVNGLKGGDTIDHVELGGEATEAGWYPIEPRGAVVVNPNNGDVTGNYDINYVNGTLTILGEAAVSNVVAASNEPWDGKVQIAFNVTNSPAACLPDWNMPFLSIVATDNLTGSNYVSFASALSGDTDTADGAHMVTWDFKAQGIEFYSTNVTFTVAYLKMPDWCVIDLSGGTNAVSYPVTYLAAEPDGGFTNDLYRTTKLAMRLIGPGTFEMGDSGSTETTEITNAFYCAVFETTQRQWELVTGERPSWFKNETCYATRPVERVSWNMIRGDADTYDWPNVQGVASDSFVGVLRQKTGLTALDLPAEAQWEYACRAGTTTDYNNGKNWSGNNPCPNMDEVGRYWNNGGQGANDDSSTDNGTAAVGSYLPNVWGLYDMHGNVCEWCLERYSSSVSYRVKRGGGWGNNADHCTSSYRYSSPPSYGNDYLGFRLVRTLSNNFESERSAEAVAGAERAGTVCSGASEPITVGKKPAAELAAELKWKHLKATGTYFAQLKLTCTNWLDSGISDLKFMFADRVGADGKTSAALWSTPLRSANTNVEESDGTTYRFVALDESLIEEENTPVVYGVADLSATAIPVAERTIEMYVRTGVAPEGQNADSAQVDDFVGYVCWTSSDEACAVPVVASGVKAGPKFGAVRPLAGASLPSPKTLNESLALGVPVVEGASPYCRVAEFSVDGERIKGRIEVGAGENVGSLGANATVTVLGAASPAGPFEELGAVEVAEDGSFSLAVVEGAQFFKLRIDVKEVVR